jgi:hypothetical protein
MDFEIHRSWDGHPALPEERARVRVERTADPLQVTIDAPWHGDPPPDGPAGSKDGLWQHEVVELFLVGRAQTYLELEFGPHGHYLVLLLEGVRRPKAVGLQLDFAVERMGDRWRGVARVPREYLPPGPYTANAYAIHGHAEGRRYLACTPVPGPQPDFHRLEVFPAVDL